VKYRSILLFGAPGSGKGTQGKIFGASFVEPGDDRHPHPTWRLEAAITGTLEACRHSFSFRLSAISLSLSA
jgi:hypothetical protein